MSAYADTSFLLSYFGQDAKTPVAHGYAGRWTQPPRIAWTRFGELEFNNAARALIFAGRLDLKGLNAMRLRVREDLSGSVLAVRLLPGYRHYETAELISEAHTVNLGARTLDLLPVAAARVLGVREFLTFDVRQRELAARCGLQVAP